MRISHIGWNLTGLSLPLLVAAFTVPQLIQKLGNERFGLLALTWGLIGYAGALDLGIGRALTQRVSALIGDRNFSTIPDYLATASRITLITGVIGGFIIAVYAIFVNPHAIGIRTVPLAQVQQSMLLLAVALPAQAMSATYRGINEAFLNFKGISLLRVGLGIANFGGPFLVSIYTNNMAWLVATLVVSRLFSLFIFRYLALRCLAGSPDTTNRGVYSKSITKSLFSFGGWITVSSVASPILTQLDRFLIASILTAAVVTVYVLPYEMVVQSLILVGAITTVIFPHLSKLIREQPNHWQPYFRKWLVIVMALMLFSCIVLYFLLPIILPLWIKDHLNPQSIVIGQILCIGVFANAIGSMFYALIQAKGRPDLTAKLHLVELPLYCAVLLLFLHQFGVVGAAWAWVARMVFDAVALAICSRFIHD
jgi:O-antigen/teichoic acid export membrane protein